MILLLLACTKAEPEPVDSGDPPAILTLDAEVLTLPELDLRTQTISAGTVLLQNFGGAQADELTLSFDDSAGATWTAELIGAANLPAGDQRVIHVQAEFSAPGLATAQLRVSAGDLSDTVVLFTTAHAPVAVAFGSLDGGGDCAARWSGRVSNPGDRTLGVSSLSASLDGVALPITGISPNLAILPGETAAFSAALPLDVAEGAQFQLTLMSDDPLNPVLTHVEALSAQSSGFSEQFVSPGDAVRLVVVHEVNGGGSFYTTYEALLDHTDDVALALLGSTIQPEVWFVEWNPADGAFGVPMPAGDAATTGAWLDAWLQSGLQQRLDLSNVLTEALDASNNALFSGAPSVAVALITDTEINADGHDPALVLDGWHRRLDPGARLTVHGMSRAPGDACGVEESDFIPALINATGGLFHSQCMLDWPGFYAALLAQQAMLHRSMNLGSAADPASLQVWVDGAPLSAANWTLTDSTLRIDDHIPLAVGATIDLRYTEAGCP